jgi:hypothetical protein
LRAQARQQATGVMQEPVSPVHEEA